MKPSSTPAPRRSRRSGKLRVADVALFYGARTGGIRTYLDAKARYCAATGAYEHHVIVPGRRERHDGSRHELRSLALAAANGYRLPLGTGALKATLRDVRPDALLLHDPWWASVGVTRLAHELDAAVLAFHHVSCDLEAEGLPGPRALYKPPLRAWFRHAWGETDGVVSAVDPGPDSGRAAVFPLRLGVDPVFRPPPRLPKRADHVLYVGRLGREKGLFELLDAAYLAPDPWPLRIVGAGSWAAAIAGRVDQLGLGERVSFHPFACSRRLLARMYTEASCVVMPGAYETFGLVALEAAASGARVVACTTAPSAALAGALADTFEPGDRGGLVEAIERARRRGRDVRAAAQLATTFSWERAFAAELADLERVVRARGDGRADADRSSQAA